MFDSADANASLVYRFGRFEVDEARYSFKINGSAVPLTGKPWALLLLLLQHAPITVSRNEIFDRVWRGRVVTDGVLRRAVSRLLIALADSDQRLLRTMHGVGFALTAKVERLASLVIADDVTMVKRDTKLRGHEAWQLLEPLTIGGHAAVWVGEHRSTHERHLFKFARDSTSLAVLKRELAVSRLMEESAVGGLLPVLDWELSSAPYFIEQNFIEGSTMDA